MFKSEKAKNLFIVSVFSFLILLLDQIIKFLVISEFIFHLKIYRNYNYFFGIFPGWFFVIFILFFLVLFFLCFRENKKIEFFINNIIFRSRFLSAACGLAFGGAISNLLDRSLNGYVIDYFVFINLFSFNIADLAIFFGTATLAFEMAGKYGE